jgi:ribosome-associated protein
VKAAKTLKGREPREARNLAKRIAKAASEKNAGDIRILDVRGLVGYADYMVLCEASSDRQTRAIAGHVEDTLKAAGIRPYSSEGAESGSWLILDYSDVILHIQLPETRGFYDLDGLWHDALPVPADEPEGTEPPKPAARRKAAKPKAKKPVRLIKPAKKAPARKR